MVAVRNSSPGRPEPCERNLVAAAVSCGRLMVKHPWPLLEIRLSDFRRLATLNINTYLPQPAYLACVIIWLAVVVAILMEMKMVTTMANKEMPNARYAG